jgi:hypothetical protein
LSLAKPKLTLPHKESDMLELKTHQDIDQLVWSCISESTNPLDFLDYIRHVRNRFAQQEQAFDVMTQRFLHRSSC